MCVKMCSVGAFLWHAPALVRSIFGDANVSINIVCCANKEVCGLCIVTYIFRSVKHSAYDIVE